MNHPQSSLWMMLGVVAAFVSFSARADVIFSNLGPGDSYDTLGFHIVAGANANPGYPPYGSSDFANSFTVGSADFVFTSAQVSLAWYGGTNQIDLLLLSNTAANLPGSILQTIPLKDIPEVVYPASGILITADAVAPLTLKAGTTYWLGATVPAPDSTFDWFINNTDDHAFVFRINGGAWSTDQTGLGLRAAAFQIKGTPVTVPEPRLALASVLVMASFCVRHYRHREASRGHSFE